VFFGHTKSKFSVAENVSCTSWWWLHVYFNSWHISMSDVFSIVIMISKSIQFLCSLWSLVSSVRFKYYMNRNILWCFTLTLYILFGYWIALSKILLEKWILKFWVPLFVTWSACSQTFSIGILFLEWVSVQFMRHHFWIL
jgi:hypothetical protein